MSLAPVVFKGGGVVRSQHSIHVLTRSVLQQQQQHYKTMQTSCKFGVVQCNITSQNGPAGLDMTIKVSKLSQSINHTQRFVPNHNTNAGPVTVWLQVCYMHLCCAHVLPWSVCARSAQHRAPAVSHTGAGHKGGNPYTPPHQNGLGEVQPSHSHNKGPKLPMSAIPTIAEYWYMKNPKGKNR